ncbi:MAG: hypothetical protein LLG04_10845 [Parachlamydia sp.]|nr:hypothetical protein [Parachlamydia sp.]
MSTVTLTDSGFKCYLPAEKKIVSVRFDALECINLDEINHKIAFYGQMLVGKCHEVNYAEEQKNEFRNVAQQILRKIQPLNSRPRQWKVLMLNGGLFAVNLAILRSMILYRNPGRLMFRCQDNFNIADSQQTMEQLNKMFEDCREDCIQNRETSEVVLNFPDQKIFFNSNAVSEIEINEAELSFTVKCPFLSNGCIKISCQRMSVEEFRENIKIPSNLSWKDVSKENCSIRSYQNLFFDEPKSKII